jgi:hypothetical protein
VLSTVRFFGAAQYLPVARVIGAPAGGIAADWWIFRCHEPSRRYRIVFRSQADAPAGGDGSSDERTRLVSWLLEQKADVDAQGAARAARASQSAGCVCAACVRREWMRTKSERPPASTSRVHEYGVSSEWFGEALLILLC